MLKRNPVSQCNRSRNFHQLENETVSGTAVEEFQ